MTDHQTYEGRASNLEARPSSCAEIPASMSDKSSSGSVSSAFLLRKQPAFRFVPFLTHIHVYFLIDRTALLGFAAGGAGTKEE